MVSIDVKAGDAVHRGQHVAIMEAMKMEFIVEASSYMEIDDVIDPMETRRWIMQGLRSVPASIPGDGRRRPFIDTW
jgi:acetyl-CoA carboxylase carboxyltransferase component